MHHTTFMQCHQPIIRRSVCSAYNAYNPAIALRATFGTTTRRRNAKVAEDAQETDDHIPSILERNRLKRLETNSLPKPEPQRELAGEERIQMIREGEPLVRQTVRVLNTKSDASDELERRIDPTTNKFVQPYLWQEGIKVMASRHWQITDPKSRWAGRMSKTMRDRLISKVFDYRPFNVVPQSCQSQTHIVSPWKLKSATEFNGILLAENELKNFAKWAEPTRNEKIARSAVAEETMGLINASLKDNIAGTTGVEVHGSERTGLAFAWSDIDIRIWDERDPQLPWHKSAPRLLQHLRLVAQAMQESKKWTVVTVRDSFYPILNAQHIESGLDIQIVASLDTHAQEAVIAKYLEEIPPLRTIFYAVRTFFSMRGFNDVYTGGLGSYGIFVLLAAIIKREQHANKNKSRDPSRENLDAFTSFFNALDAHPMNRNPTHPPIDLTKYGIACHPYAKFKKHKVHPSINKYVISAQKRGDEVRAGQWRIGQKDMYLPFLLCLQDPANPNNDLGRKTFAIKHILASIAYSYRNLKHNLLKAERAVKAGIPWVGNSMLHTFLGRPHEIYHEQRTKLEGYGMEIAKQRRAEKGPKWMQKGYQGHKVLRFGNVEHEV